MPIGTMAFHLFCSIQEKNIGYKCVDWLHIAYGEASSKHHVHGSYYHKFEIINSNQDLHAYGHINW